MKLSKKILLLILLIGTLFLTACGIEVTTDLTLEKGFQGSRTITCYVSNQDMTAYFRGDISKIDDMIENSCPDCFTYSKAEKSNGTAFTFQITFSSLEEYKTLVSSVLNFSPEITFNYTDSLFSNSITLKENFSSADLLCWFEILLKEEYSIKESQISSLWEMKNTTVNWKETSYKSETDNIDISQSEQISFDGIEIYTVEKDDRSFERTIVFKIPKETLDTEVLNLQESFQDITPEDAKGTWTGTKTGKNYEITFASSDFATLSQITDQILNGKAVTGTASFTFSDYQVFKYQIERKENLDFSHFLCTDEALVSVAYYYKPNSITTTNVEEMQQKVNNAFADETDDDGYYLLYKGDCATLNIIYLGTVNIPVDSYTVTTTLLDNGQFERTFVFTYLNSFTEEESNYLLSFFEKNNTSHLTMMMDNGILTLSQTGNAEDLNESSHLLFGSDDNFIEYSRDPSILSSKQSTFMKESIDLSRFLGSVNKDTPGEYTFLQNSKETMKKFSMDSNY